MSDTSGENPFAENLEKVKQQIQHCADKSGRSVSDIKLIAVSKTRPLDEVKLLVSSGQCCFGENTVQDAMSKIPYLGSNNLEWHFIGHLQSKKAGKIPGYFQWVHSVDSIKLAQKLSTAMLNNSKNAKLNCLIQVNISGEASKSGLMPAEVQPYLKELIDLNLPCLQWRGLMTIGVKADEKKTRSAFAQLKVLQENCKAEFELDTFDQLSMGMSGDYCLAVEEGATIVRVGTSIFGERN